MKSEPVPKKEIVKNTVDNKSPRKITEVNDNFELDIVD